MGSFNKNSAIGAKRPMGSGSVPNYYQGPAAGIGGMPKIGSMGSGIGGGIGGGIGSLNSGIGGGIGSDPYNSAYQENS